DRTLLAILTVNSLADNTTSGDGLVTLREAVIASNFDTMTDLNETGSGADEIVFSGAASSGKIRLYAGELFLNGDLTITGNGTADTIIDGNNATRLMDIAGIGTDVFLTGLTLQSGRLGGNGANTADSTFSGAAILARNGNASLTITDCAITENATTGNYAEGGAIFTNDRTLTIVRSTIAANSTSGQGSHGGAIFSLNADVTIRDSTISGNSTLGANAEGGGIFNLNGTIDVLNSTFSGNKIYGSGMRGGAIHGRNDAITVINSTIVHNESVNGDAGGILADTSAPLSIRNSIVALNTDSGGDHDIQHNSTRSTLNSLIGINTGTTLSEDHDGDLNSTFVGGAAEGAIDPLILSLANNGGPTRTHMLRPDSLAVDHGSNTIANPVQPHDQRGSSFSRIVNGAVDMGAVERPDITGIPFEVDTLVDDFDGDFSDGDRSLREVISLANSVDGPQAIAFDPALSGVISLTLGQIDVTQDVTITGNGPMHSIIDANAASRVLDLWGVNIDVTLTGLTLRNGRLTGNGVNTLDSTFGGAAIRSRTSGTLTLNDCTLVNNATTGDYAEGGAIWTNNGPVSLHRTTIAGNSTAGQGSHGGGIFSWIAPVTFLDSTLSGNTTLGVNAEGGGLFSNFGATTATNSTVSGNMIYGNSMRGGGLHVRSAAVSVTNSTIADNHSINGDAGGILADSGAALTVRNSIVASNTDSAGEHDIQHNLTLSAEFSLIGVDTGTSLSPTGVATPDGNGNFVGSAASPIDPLLGPLQDNGGPAFTHALLTGSLAINSGSNTLAVNASLTNDQRGAPFFRIFGGTIDMGAIEDQFLRIEGNTAFLTGTPNRDSIVYRVAQMQA
ncbi:MAG: right-handed parallel beta-helix repeat-containing protein, partial [Planctomycetaceae bacterium]|nr:right-handed parallel beta-helix repeat-containing protein [Planctomycetaceae bacterium]